MRTVPLSRHRLAYRMGITTGVGTLVLMASAMAVVDLPLWFVVTMPVATAALALAATHRWLDRRLDEAREALTRIRMQRFDELDEVRPKPRDELDDLLLQIRRTGLNLKREILALKSVEDYRREYLGNVSHELKTPIFTIQGFAETLLDGALEDERNNRRFVEKILRNADRLANLARDLSEISRFETGELKLAPSSFDLGELAREVIESLEYAAETHAVTLRREIPAALPRVVADRERIRQVLSNLIDNAIKYNRPGGTIDVEARVEPSGAVEVSVSDDGIGISPDDLPRLTERFYRVDKSRSRYEGGTGLGLAIVKHILAGHRRRLHVESEVGKGSRFSFSLDTSASQKAR